MRWRPCPDLDAGSCASGLREGTSAALAAALEASNDANPFLRDVYLWNDRDGDGCHEEDLKARGMLVMTDEGCWENVHPDYL